MQNEGGEANVFRGSSKPSAKRFYKYMFIARVNYDDSVDFNLCSLEKQGNWDAMKTFLGVFEGMSDQIFGLLTGAVLVEGAKDILFSWAQALNLTAKQLSALEQGEFITEFDMTKRLIEGNYCELDKNTNQLFLKN